MKKESVLVEGNIFKTSDLALAAALCCGGYEIESIDRKDPLRVVFFIRRNEFLDEVLQLYFTHHLKVEPLSFFGYLKELKTRIYHSDDAN